MIKTMLLFGGESSEHTVSISSARNVFAAIDKSKFDVVLSFIDKTGRWWLIDSFDQLEDLHDAVQLLPILGTKSFATVPSTTTITPDVILPILHGENGEDGTVQGLAQLLHIPIVGCGIAASAICIDKVLTKRLLEHGGIKTVQYAVHMSYEAAPSYSELSAQLGTTMFVKPARCGSSVGVSKATNETEFNAAVAEAHKYDSKILIERAIKARELEVAMIGNNDKSAASCVGEIKPDGEFYSFDSKYASSSQSKVTIPAELDAELSEKIRSAALKAYAILGCSGLSRIDFFLSETGELYLNEVNTLPGFTNISMYPKLWDNEGLSYAHLIEALIGYALEK